MCVVLNVMNIGHMEITLKCNLPQCRPEKGLAPFKSMGDSWGFTKTLPIIGVIQYTNVCLPSLIVY